MNGFDRDGAQDFTRPSSEGYPQFEEGMRAGIDGWWAEGGGSEVGTGKPIDPSTTQIRGDVG